MLGRICKALRRTAENTTKRPRRPRRANRQLLTFEALEERVVLSTQGSVFLEDGVLRILGSEQPDTAQVEIVDSKVQALLNGSVQQFDADQVRGILFDGGAGNDSFVNGTNIPCQASGGDGDDQLVGGTANDSLDGGAGNDWLVGAAGDDNIVGGAGSDVVLHVEIAESTDILHTDENDTLYVLTAKRELERRTAISTQTIASDVVKAVQALDGRVVSLDVEGRVRFNDQTVWGGVRDVAFAPDGTLYLLGVNGNLERSTSHGWELVDTAVSKYCFQPDGSVYSLDSNGTVSIDGVDTWAGIRDFGFAPNGTFYLLGANTNLERRTSSGWQPVASGVSKFSFAADSSVYSLDSNGTVSIDGVDTWGGVRDFGFDAQGTLYLLGTSRVLEQRTSSGWDVVARDVARFSIEDNGALVVNGERLTPNSTLYVVGSDGSVERRTNDGWQSFEHFVVKSALGPDGRVYMLDTEGFLSRDLERQWGNVRDFAFAADGRLYLLGTNRVLERQTPSGWERVDDDVIKVAGASGRVYSLNARGDFREDGQIVCDWLRDFAIDANGMVYLLNHDGTLQCLSDSRAIDHNVVKLATPGNGTIFYLATDQSVRNVASGQGVILWRNVRDFQGYRILHAGKTSQNLRKRLLVPAGDESLAANTAF